MKTADHSSRQRIIDAALSLFKVHGYGNVAIKDICEAADCSNGTFYYHFGSMSGLMKAIRSQSAVITPELLVKLAVISSAWEKLWTIHSAVCMNAEKRGASLNFQILFSYEKDDKAEQRAALLQTDQFIIPIIKQGQESGEIRNQTSAETLCNTVGLTIIGVLYYWYMSDGEINLESYMKTELQNLYDIRPDLRT